MKRNLKLQPFSLFINIFLFLNVFQIISSQESTQNIRCSSVPFCHRLMFVSESKVPLYFLDNKTIEISGTNKDKNNIFKAIIKNYNQEYINDPIDLELIIYILKRGIFRIKIRPKNQKRFELNEEDDIFNIKDTIKNSGIKISNGDKNTVIYYFSKKKKIKYELLINQPLFQMTYKVDNKNIYFINSKNLFDLEKMGKDFIPSETDSMTSIRMDMSIPESILLTGLPERCGSSILTDTNINWFYHFYNIDVFKYDFNQYNSIYGSIPYIMSFSYGGTIFSGFYWNNPSETFISLKSTNEGKQLLFLSESGIFDFSFFASLNLDHYYKTMNEFLGQTPLPNIFSIGYHQSRFSYDDLNEVKLIDEKFDKYEIPYDSIWLDIDHTDNKKYFTYDIKKFPKEETKNFFSDLNNKGRKVVVILDPHIKVDNWYPIYYKSKNNFFIKKEDSSDFIGNCWSGDSSFLDFFNKDTINFWKNLIIKEDNYFHSGVNNIHIWNDMNEPSVFKTSRNTLPKNTIIKYNSNNYEHREVHNLYGYLMHKASYEALLEKYNNKIRPFILTRSFYIGSHKYSAMWTGDTKSTFESLKNTISMMIALSISGYSFTGCDIGGFAEEGSINLYKRWYQNGVFYPFFRGHSHESVLRREIWLFSENDFLTIKNAIITRYNLIPYIYTQFYINYNTGMPIMKPLWFSDKSELALTEFADIEYYFGKGILVRPVLNENEDRNNKINIFLPENERWYDFYDYSEIDKSKKNKKIEYEINNEKIGAFIKGGEIIPKKMRLRRSIQKMKNDPLTIIITLDLENKAKGIIYFDDEESLEYQKGKYSILKIYYQKYEIDFEWISYNYFLINNIEKIIILGENNEFFYKRDIKAELVTNKNSKINLEIESDYQNKRIEIIRMNKYKVTDIQKITFK